MAPRPEPDGPLDEILVSTRVVFPDGVRAAAVGVHAGRIAWLGEPRDAPVALVQTDLGSKALLPGVVDTHVHLDDPGTDWEGFASGGRAAAAGGVTTLVDMPLNSLPVTTTVAALQAKRDTAANQCLVDYGFWGGVVPGNTAELEGLAAAGVLGFKCFLSPSGLEEFANVGRADLEVALPIIAASGLPLLVHAEAPARLQACPSGGGYRDYVESRPATAEAEAIAMLAVLALKHGATLHIVHVSSADGVAAVAAAREDGALITGETCPHYLTFAAEEIADGRCEFKCAPPIRTARHRDALWRGLEDGALSLIASDHSPCPPDLKHLADGDLAAAWGGVASLEVSLAAVWTGLRHRGGSLDQLARWMSAAPAELAGLDSSKGMIAIGFDADLVVFDPDATQSIDGSALHHRHPVTPYSGLTLHGVVAATLVRGAPVYHRPDPAGGGFAEAAHGRAVA